MTSTCMIESVQDTDEILAAPVLGPLARQAVRAIDPGLDPAETVMPVSTLPGTSWLPSPLPLPDIRQRIYFRWGTMWHISIERHAS
jgi:hypothetical protein